MRFFKTVIGGSAAAALLIMPGALRLSNYKKSTVNGVTTLDEAVIACQKSGLSGWELVAYAQQLVARKFATYSTRNLWDPPARAFAYGMGYCTQYNLALKQLLERLGIETRAVFSQRVKIFDVPDWTMGHTWLRVTFDGKTLDVCAGRKSNTPGHNHFEPMTPVRQGNPLFFFLTHMGMIPFCGFVEWKALLQGRDPGWTFRPSA